MELKRNETMKKKTILFVSLLMFLFASNSMMAQQRRPVDSYGIRLTRRRSLILYLRISDLLFV